MTGALLEVDGVTSGYGSLAAVQDLQLAVAEREVVALLGANGAGKTTTLLTIAGELVPFRGEIRFDGVALAGPLHRRARRGVALVTEERSIFRQLTVAENLILGRGTPSAAYDLAPELYTLRHRKAGLLSGGEQQILTLARALASQPRVLLADELCLGLAPMMSDRMLGFVRRAADAGVAVVLVEQQAARALAIADRAYVLHRGRVELAGTANDVLGQLDRLSQTYFGMHATSE
jgi:branched-chain amino acid transport system ATP-binding protein